LLVLLLYTALLSSSSTCWLSSQKWPILFRMGR